MHELDEVPNAAHDGEPDGHSSADLEVLWKRRRRSARAQQVARSRFGPTPLSRGKETDRPISSLRTLLVGLGAPVHELKRGAKSATRRRLNDGAAAHLGSILDERSCGIGGFLGSVHRKEKEERRGLKEWEEARNETRDEVKRSSSAKDLPSTPRSQIGRAHV